MKVRIICKEDVNDWILGKFALKLRDCLLELGVSCDIGKTPDPNADINHNIIYYEYDGFSQGVNTFMITHIDEKWKLDLLRSTLKSATMGICMSNQMMEWLAKMGIDKKKISYVDPAHDQCALVKKYVIGIASRVYPDGRKREQFFDFFARDLNPNYFHFKFMGAGWESQVNNLKSAGFEVTYFNQFIKKEYYKFIQSLDYYLYTGEDEGQMGFVDAAAAGVKTIVTPQGYHLDAPEALTFSFWSYEELKEILLKLQYERETIVNSVKEWTWMDYAKKHLELWKYLLGETVNSNYKDGLYAYLNFIDRTIETNNEFVEKEERKLIEIGELHKVKRDNNIPSLYDTYRRRIRKLFRIIKSIFNKQ